MLNSESTSTKRNETLVKSFGSCAAVLVNSTQATYKTATMTSTLQKHQSMSSTTVLLRTILTWMIKPDKSTCIRWQFFLFKNICTSFPYIDMP